MCKVSTCNTSQLATPTSCPVPHANRGVKRTSLQPSDTEKPPTTLSQYYRSFGSRARDCQNPRRSACRHLYRWQQQQSLGRWTRHQDTELGRGSSNCERPAPPPAQGPSTRHAALSRRRCNSGWPSELLQDAWVGSLGLTSSSVAPSIAGAELPPSHSGLVPFTLVIDLFWLAPTNSCSSWCTTPTQFSTRTAVLGVAAHCKCRLLQNIPGTPLRRSNGRVGSQSTA